MNAICALRVAEVRKQENKCLILLFPLQLELGGNVLAEVLLEWTQSQQSDGGLEGTKAAEDDGLPRGFYLRKSL